MTNVSATVVVVNSSTLEDERQDGTVDRIVASATAAVKQFDSDGVVPRVDVPDLLSAVNKALEVAAATDGPDIVVIVDDGDTGDDDTDAISAALEGLDNDTFVLFAIVSNQPETVNRTFLDELDVDHTKADQIDVAYPEHDIAAKLADEVVPFVKRVA